MTELSEIFLTSIKEGSAKFSAMTGPLDKDFITTDDEEEKKGKRKRTGKVEKRLRGGNISNITVCKALKNPCFLHATAYNQQLWLKKKCIKILAWSIYTRLDVVLRYHQEM